MPASAWDPYNWFSWYSWWLPENKEEEISTETPIEDENIDSIEEEIFPKEEEIKAEPIKTPEEKPKPKRKRRVTTKKVSTKTQDAIELVLRPKILEELEKEAIIQIILEAHIESKTTSNIQTEVWHCNYCEPNREFRDYFEFSEHFFNEHMQPGLQKISDFKKEEMQK